MLWWVREVGRHGTYWYFPLTSCHPWKYTRIINSVLRNRPSFVACSSLSNTWSPATPYVSKCTLKLIMTHPGLVISYLVTKMPSHALLTPSIFPPACDYRGSQVNEYCQPVPDSDHLALRAGVRFFFHIINQINQMEVCERLHSLVGFWATPAYFQRKIQNFQREKI